MMPDNEWKEGMALAAVIFAFLVGIALIIFAASFH